MGAIVAAVDGGVYGDRSFSDVDNGASCSFLAASLLMEWFHYLEEGLSGTRRAHANDRAERVKETVHGAGVVKGSCHPSASFLSLSARS